MFPTLQPIGKMAETENKHEGTRKYEQNQF